MNWFILDSTRLIYFIGCLIYLLGYVANCSRKLMFGFVCSSFLFYQPRCDVWASQRCLFTDADCFFDSLLINTCIFCWTMTTWNRKKRWLIPSCLSYDVIARFYFLFLNYPSLSLSIYIYIYICIYIYIYIHI